MNINAANNRRIQTDPSSKPNPSYNVLLVELLDAILSDDDTAFEAKEAALLETLAQEEDKYSKSGGWRHPRRKKSHKLSILQQMHEDDEEAMRFSAKLLSNTRPPVNFVLHAPAPKKQHQQQEDLSDSDDNDQKMSASNSDIHSDSDEETDDQSETDHTPPLFDGSIGANTGSLLHLACIVDEPFILAMFLVLGAEPRSKHSAFRRLPIHEAACSNSTECLSLLLDLSKQYNQSDAEENNRSGEKYLGSHCFPVFFASASKKTYPVYNLLKPRHVRDLSPSVNNSLPTTSQSSNGAQSRFPFVSTLRLIKTYVEQIKSKQITPLIAAKELLSRTPLPFHMRSTLSSSLAHTLSVPDGHGNTALHWAAFKNCADCVSILLAAGANPNAQTYSTGWTPLHDAAYSDAPEATQLLLEGGANPDARANSGATPLCFAAQEDAPRAAEILLKAGADTFVRCCGHSLGTSIPNNGGDQHNELIIPQLPMMTSRFSGYTPLHYCAHYNAAKAANVLIRYNAPIEIYDLADRLPIHVAVGRGSSDVLRELLIAGAKVEVDRNQPSNHLQQQSHENTEDEGSQVTRNQPLGNQQEIGSPTAANLHGSFARQISSNRIIIHPNLHSPPISPLTSRQGNVITPASSPVLKQMLPRQPVNSTKPWNCLSQKSIDECVSLIEAAEGHWSPHTHKLFSPTDRRAVLELLRVGKRLEQQGTGLFLELWPYVLSFCGRGWFDKDDHDANMSPLQLPLQATHDQKMPAATNITKITNTSMRNPSSIVNDDNEEGMEDNEFTQFELDGESW